MSVLIKGMELPKDCPYCKMAHYNASDEFTGCAVIPGKRYAMHNDAVYAKSTQRPEWCPLSEIPVPHGRLIDASYKVDMPFYDDEYEEHSMRTVTVEELLLMADNGVPTVIEAEGR